MDNSFELHRKSRIEIWKKKVHTDEALYLQTKKKIGVYLISLLSRLYRLRLRFNRMKYIQNDLNKDLCTHEVYSILCTWSDLKIKVKGVYDMFYFGYEVVYVSEKRDWIDASVVHIESPNNNIYIKVFSVEKDEQLNELIVRFTDTRSYYTLQRDDMYDYIELEDKTRIIFPLDFVYIKDDVIYGTFCSSFYYRDEERAHVGRKYDNVSRGRVNFWRLLFKDEPSLEKINDAYYETEKLLSDIGVLRR